MLSASVPTHDRSVCPLCQDDASKHNHCSVCGLTFDDDDALYEHLGGDDDTPGVSPCWDFIARTFRV